MYITIVLIAFIMVNLLDISGFIWEMEKILSRWLHIKARIPKPFSCSYCMTHWVGLLYLIIAGNLNFGAYAYLLAVCAVTPVMKDIITTVLNILNKLIYWLNEII